MVYIYTYIYIYIYLVFTTEGSTASNRISYQASRAKFLQLLQFHLLFSIQILFWLLLWSVAMFILIEMLHRQLHERSKLFSEYGVESLLKVCFPN